MRWSCPWLVVALVACGGSPVRPPNTGAVASEAGAKAPYAPSALDKPPLTATPDELLAIANAAPKGDWPAVILREDHDATFDAAGVLTEHWRYVYVIRTEQAAIDYASRGGSWYAGTAARPTIRARIIQPNGSVKELRADTITDAPDNDEGNETVRRAYSYELSGLKPGVVVEEDIVRTDKPRIGVDNFSRFFVGAGDAPTLQTHATFKAPEGKPPLFFANVAGPVRTTKTTTNGTTTWSWEIGRIEANPEAFDNIPTGEISVRQITFASGSSWQQLAQEMSAVVDRQTQGKHAVTWPSTLSKPTQATREAIVEITQWVIENVDSAYDWTMMAAVPQPPNLTIMKGGSVLDRSVVLVALLRKAGFNADLVLVNRTGKEDIARQVPSVIAFDHSLVRVAAPGGDLWICPEAEDFPIGQLPSDDHDRFALIASRSTQDLARTPPYPPGENAIKEVRTYHVADLGPSDVTEVTIEGGSHAIMRRRQLAEIEADPSDDTLTKEMRSQADNAYEGLYKTHAVTVAPDRLTTTLTLEVTRAYGVNTQRDALDLSLPPDVLLWRVPDELVDETNLERTQGFRWEVPHTYEIEHRIELPTGYVAPPLPKDRTVPLGTASFSETWRDEGRSLVITHRFDSGQVNLTADEFAETREALRAFQSSERTYVHIGNRGWELAKEGKYKDALVELEAQVKAHPKTSVHRQRLAYALMQVGLGTASQAMAREAVKLAPQDPDAYIMLGWTLERDAFGRAYAEGWDKPAVLAAYAKARALDPDHDSAAHEHGRILEMGEGETSFEAGADIAKAIEAWRVAYLHDDDQTDGFRLAFAQFYAGQYQEAQDVLWALRSTPRRDSLLVATYAMLKSPADALSQAASIQSRPSASAELVSDAIETLRQARRYAEASALATAAKGTIAGSARVSGLHQLKQVDALPAKSKTPEDAARGALEAILKPTPTATWLADAPLLTELRTAHRTPQLRGYVDDEGYSVVRDLVLSSAAFTTVGEPGGPWRVEVAVPGVATTFYVVLDKGQTKVVGSSLADAGVGRAALRYAAAGAVDDAGQLIDWLAQVAPSAAWKPAWDGQPRTKDSVTFAAAVIAAESDVKRTAGSLIRCTGASSTPAPVRGACFNALERVYSKQGRWTELLAMAKQRESTDIFAGVFLRALASARLGKFTEADAAVADVTKVNPLYGKVARFAVEAERGNYSDAFRDESELAPQMPSLLVSYAWLHAVSGINMTGALTNLNLFITDPAAATSDALLARAALQVETGDLGGARVSILQAMANEDRDQPDARELYIMGRIAELAGRPTEALAFYKQVKRDPADSKVTSAPALAAKRISVLNTKP